MAETLREVMRQSPVTVPPDMNLVEASRTMKEFDIGDLIVMENGTVVGIVTDRDITIRATAEGKDPKSTTLAEIYSKNLVTIEPDATVDDAVELMRSKALRRLPVVEGNKPVGVVSLGDLAIDRDPSSALADISAAPPNQ